MPRMSDPCSWKDPTCCHGIYLVHLFYTSEHLILLVYCVFNKLYSYRGHHWQTLTAASTDDVSFTTLISGIELTII